MTAQCDIRPARYTDIDSLVELLADLFCLEADFAPDSTKQRAGLEMMLADPGQRCVMVAEHQGMVVGMCTAQLLISTAEGGLAALIEDVVVMENFRGRGVGRNLLIAMEQWALSHDVKRFELLADRENTPALTFYDRMGWHKTDLICLHKKYQDK